MGPSDHDKNDPFGGASAGDHGPTHASGGPSGGEGWLRSVLENSSEVVKVVDPDGTLRYASPAFGRVFGHDPVEAVGKMNVLDYVHPDDLPRVLEETERATSVGGTISNRVEYRFRHADGSWRWVESVGTYLPDDPQVGGVVVSVRDVTGRKEAEGALREAEDRYRTLVERVPAIIYIQRPIEGKTASYDTTYMSPRVEEVLGYPARAFVEDPHLWDRVIHPEDRGRARALDERTDPTGEPFSVEYRVVRKDGGVVWLGDEAALVRDGSGEPLYWLGVQTDITARKDWEETLKESEERYRVQSRELSLLHQVRSNLSRELDPAGVCYEVVEAIAETYGYTQVGAYLLEGEDLLLQHQVGYKRVIGRIPLTEGVCGRAVRTGRSVLVEDVSADPDFLGAVQGVTSEICVPLFDGGEAAGFINVESRGGVRLTQKDLELMEALGEHVNGALSRARLHARLRDSEKHFRALTQNSSDLVTLLSANGTIRYQSTAIGRILGYGQEETIGDNAFDHVHPDDLSRVEMAFAEGLVDPGRRPSVEYRFRHKDGRWVWLESVGNNLLGEPGVGGYVVNSRDVTGRKEAERALRESEERFRGAFEDAPMGVALVGLPSSSGQDRRYLRVNPALCEMLGYTEEELLSMSTSDVTHPGDAEESRARMERLLEEGGSKYALEKRYVCKDGRVVWAMLNVSLVREPDGRPSHFVSQVQDVTERRALEDRLRHQALHDPLTGLPNRTLFIDRLGQALGRTGRQQGRQAAVLFMDLDGFKGVNDSLGHETGDLLLTVVAQRLGRCLRPEDTLARFGGDEFVVLLGDVGTADDAVRVAERIAEGLGDPFRLDGRELYARASIGIATGNARTKTPEDLLRDADTAMYRAKDGGLDYSLFDPAMHERAVARLETENDLGRATERGEFVVHYQPIVDLGTSGVWGVEALVRWRHPERGLVGPDEFVPVAEETGLIVPVGAWVLEEACRQTKAWQRSHPGSAPLVVIVNLSARQLRHPGCVGSIEGALRKTGLWPGGLGLDVTESAFIDGLEGNAGALDRIKGMGVRVSIDDFGTGYSSLSYLKRLPADAIKIDKSFVAGLGERPDDTAIVRMTVELAHTLGMEVIAEGVETEGQAELLREMGCDMAQGYLFSKPLPPEDVPGFLGGRPS